MKILFVDLGMHIVDAMSATHAAAYDYLDVECSVDNALAPSADAIVSPANSFGFMDGGIDLAYSRHFGWDLQVRVQETIRNRPLGELLVGEAFSIETGDARIPNCIIAPTMRVPLIITDPNVVFMSTRAAIRCARDAGYNTVILPGMGTGTGAVPPLMAARQMLEGISEGLVPSAFPTNWREARGRHFARQVITWG